MLRPQRSRLGSAVMSYSDRYDPDQDFDRWYTEATAQQVVQWLRPADSVLELGCATGLMTAPLAARAQRVVAVDHASAFLVRARGRDLPNVSFVEHDIASLELAERFHHVVLANVVHEVPDTSRLFATAAAHLVAGGLLHVTVQNPRSIHRLVGRELGQIDRLDQLSARGEQLDTIRILDVADLETLGEVAGLRVLCRAGIMLKPLPNDLMATLPDHVLEGFVRAARHLPDHAAMNYVVFVHLDGDGA